MPPSVLGVVAAVVGAVVGSGLVVGAVVEVDVFPLPVFSLSSMGALRHAVNAVADKISANAKIANFFMFLSSHFNLQR